MIKRFNGVGGAAAVALGIVMMTGAPAVADSTQYMYCVFGEVGRANWKETEDVDGIVDVIFIWRSVHNDIAENKPQQYWWDGPGTLKATAYGDDYWAPYAVRISWDSSQRGTKCEDGASKNVDAPDLGPVYRDNRGVLPPLPGGAVAVNDMIQNQIDQIVCC